MKKWLPVLVFVLGLGSCFSFPQTQQDNPKDPFDRYLTSVKTHQPEAALVRFADGCGFEISHLRPRFAVGPGSSFTRVEDLGKGLASVETDFYSTAEVRVNADHVFLEVWANSDDVGSEVRYLECFIGGKLSQAEASPAGFRRLPALPRSSRRCRSRRPPGRLPCRKRPTPWRLRPKRPAPVP